MSKSNDNSMIYSKRQQGSIAPENKLNDILPDAGCESRGNFHCPVLPSICQVQRAGRGSKVKCVQMVEIIRSPKSSIKMYGNV
ncbi:predicted protein [Sclerotinia sclerotiorum 1980 UF-70]|uniref:Uncharacterized protein n=1 Tax=Sclerotinia sclerotiorum (strain ATCC 18683 / 1980 / Ss-1) TaxID=665079 RepID=A7EZB1_SCLS1|nr:predicted protein [Sclerotinia sclerotiorum 1980 UF-70]EDN94803.1 predicted protein [Sclerotinia sclerotiorum 1980 UF-70]